MRCLRSRKRFLAVALCIALAFGAAGCGAAESGEDDGGRQEASRKPLYEQGMHVLALMNEKAHSEAYISAFGANQLMESECFQKIKEHDYSTPDQVYTVIFPDNVLDVFLAVEPGMDVDGMSDALRESLNEQFFLSIPNIMIARQGTTALATASLITESYLFVDEDAVKQNLVCLYCFRDTYPVIVMFSYGEDGAVAARGSFLIVEDFRFDSEEEVGESLNLEQLGMRASDLKITQVR